MGDSGPKGKKEISGSICHSFIKNMGIEKLSKEQRKERRMIQKHLADAMEQRAKHAAIKLIREEKDVDEDIAENTVTGLFEALPILKGVKRKFIHGIAKWYVEGYFDYENKESCSRINTLLKVLFKSVAIYDVYGDFYCEQTNRFLTPEDLRILLGMEFGEQKDVDFDASNYTLKKIKTFEEIEKMNHLFPEWCIANGEEAFNEYTLNGANSLFLAFRDDYKEVKRIAGENHPRDSYGYSIICLIMDIDGNVFSTTSRWNSLNEFEEFLSTSEAEELMKR